MGDEPGQQPLQHLRSRVMDLAKCSIKLDHSVGNPEPLVNWRQSVGFPVFGAGQPTEEGFKTVAEKLNPKEKLVWFNMRQEPVAYIGGLPVALRAADAPHTNIELAATDKDGAAEVHKDAGFAENPMDREDVKEMLKLEGVKGFNEVLKSLTETSLPTITVVRVPLHEQRAL